MKLERPRFDKERGHHVVDIVHTGTAPEQNFSDRLVDTGLEQGWIKIEGDTLTLIAASETLVYTLKRTPGYYCCSTGERIPVSERAWAKFRYAGDSSSSRHEALAWLQASGKLADDYDITTAYECVLQLEQHAKWRAVRDIAGNVVAAHTQEG